MKRSQLEITLEFQCLAVGIPKPEREFRFAPPRKWRFDLAWPQHMLAVEVEGGIWTKGRHVRGSGFEKDADKRNRATVNGWRVLNFTPNHIKSGHAVALIEEALTLWGPVP